MRNALRLAAALVCLTMMTPVALAAPEARNTVPPALLRDGPSLESRVQECPCWLAVVGAFAVIVWEWASCQTDLPEPGYCDPPTAPTNPDPEDGPPGGPGGPGGKGGPGGEGCNGPSVTVSGCCGGTGGGSGDGGDGGPGGSGTNGGDPGPGGAGGSAGQAGEDAGDCAGIGG